MAKRLPGVTLPSQVAGSGRCWPTKNSLKKGVVDDCIECVVVPTSSEIVYSLSGHAHLHQQELKAQLVCKKRVD